LDPRPLLSCDAAIYTSDKTGTNLHPRRDVAQPRQRPQKTPVTGKWAIRAMVAGIPAAAAFDVRNFIPTRRCAAAA
jgi:hypothetical protein